MEIKSNHCKLAVCFFFSTFVLLQTSARAVVSPGLVNQQEVEDHGNDVQVSEARCWQLLDEIEMDEESREKSISVLLSSNNPVRKTIMTLCSAFYHKPTSLLKMIKQLLLTNEQKSKTSCVSDYEVDDYGRKSCKNDLGQAVFKTLPVPRTWLTQPNPAWQYAQVGEFIDLNGDGLPDFIVSWHDDHPGHPFYRATFVNDGKYNWIMVECESNLNYPDLFPPCQ